MNNTKYDAIIIGGGAAGMMAGIEAGKNGRKVLILEHNPSIGNKILISGGGRCNFTNINAKPENYISQNPHFMKSAFSSYSPQDFIDLVTFHEIEYYEKKLGQLFCRKSSREIIKMLLDEALSAGIEILTNEKVEFVSKISNSFEVKTITNSFTSDKLIVACGGLSFPKKGATNLGYEIAEYFGHKMINPTPALVPLTLSKEMMKDLVNLSGISFDSIVKIGKTEFRENTLITHRGLSGPAILQISSYWDGKSEITLKIEPQINYAGLLEENRRSSREVKTILSESLSSRFAEYLCNHNKTNKPINQCSNIELQNLTNNLTNWQITPNGTEGYEKAEVTLGGVDTNGLKQKTMESKLVDGLYFIGEIVDVTGWLGGYNFQWAWASGYVCGRDL